MHERFNKNRKERRIDVKLLALTDYEAVDLVLYHTNREVDKEDFCSEMELTRSVNKQMELEKTIKDCKGLPYLLIKVAEEMNKNTPLWQICVSKKGGDDYLKGTHGHSKAKRKEMIVYKKKDKDSSRIGFESEGNNNTP